MTVALAVGTGAAVGVVLGLLGAGGSLLTVPALIFLLGMTATEATGTSLLVVAAMATAGLTVHRRAGRCACRPGLQFASAGLLTSAVAGWLAGAIPDRILGVGGGFVVVPALIATLGLTAELAVGTSQLVILANALAALVGRSLGTNTIVWSTGTAFAIGGVAGAIAGSQLTGRFSPRTLQWTFAGVAAVVAVAMLVSGRGALA